MIEFKLYLLRLTSKLLDMSAIIVLLLISFILFSLFDSNGRSPIKFGDKIKYPTETEMEINHFCHDALMFPPQKYIYYQREQTLPYRAYPTLIEDITETFCGSINSMEYSAIRNASHIMYIDLKYTLWFVILNFLYFTLSELLFSKTLGRRLCSLSIFGVNGTRLGYKEVLKRNIIFIFLLLFAILMRFLLNLTYLEVSIGYFLCVYTPVILKKKSLIDIMSNTRIYYLEKHQ